MRHHHIAPRLGTFSENTARPVAFDLFFQLMSPAGGAKFVTASEGGPLSFSVIKFKIADFARISVFGGGRIINIWVFLNEGGVINNSN